MDSASVWTTIKQYFCSWPPRHITEGKIVLFIFATHVYFNQATWFKLQCLLARWKTSNNGNIDLYEGGLTDDKTDVSQSTNKETTKEKKLVMSEMRVVGTWNWHQKSLVMRSATWWIALKSDTLIAQSRDTTCMSSADTCFNKPMEPAVSLSSSQLIANGGSKWSIISLGLRHMSLFLSETDVYRHTLNCYVNCFTVIQLFYS